MLITNLILTLFLLAFFPFCLTLEKVSFKDVIFKGYSSFTLKFEEKISSSNSLQESYLKIGRRVDKIEFLNQKIPALYEDSLTNLEDLDELIIEQCDIEKIEPGALKNVPMLRKLSLKGNKLEDIPSGVFNNLEISTLDLSKNSISIIDTSAFDNMPNILNVNLNDNKLQNWDVNWFKNTPLLSRVSMINNSIQVLPSAAFKNLKGEKKFGDLPLTINLILSYNKISNIESEAFEGLKKINNLWLDNNLLEDFDDNLLENVEVHELRLDGNKINCLSGKLDNILKGTLNNLDSNPWDCKCMEDVEKWADENKKHVQLSYSKMECTLQRIKSKMTALEERLKKNKSNGSKKSDDGNEIDDLNKNSNEESEPIN